MPDCYPALIVPHLIGLALYVLNMCLALDGPNFVFVFSIFTIVAALLVYCHTAGFPESDFIEERSVAIFMIGLEGVVLVFWISACIVVTKMGNSALEATAGLAL